MGAISPQKAAPDFELATMTGGRLSLAQGLARGPVLLAFFKVACPTCQFTFPFLERMVAQFKKENVQVWGIVQDNARDAAQFASTFGVSFPILIDDTPYKVSRQYGISHVPSLFLVNADGRVEIFSDGFSKADILNIHRSISQLLSATPPALFLPGEKIPDFKPG
jgi:peroxiredoxin